MKRTARRLWRVFAFALAGAALLAGGVQAWYYAHVLWWRTHNPTQTAFMQSRMERLRAERRSVALSHRWVGYERISTQLKRAVIAAEDAKFVGHEGFDWAAIQKAIERNEKRGVVVAGASTISQQLAKNLFLSGERSWLRKGQEAIITLMLESSMPKRRILEIYLNVAEWGEDVFGAEAAARHHFGVSAAELNAEQAAWLAAMLPSPRRYARGSTTPYLQGRVHVILSRMPAAKIP